MLTTNQNVTTARTIDDVRAGVSSPSYQAYRILHLAFIVAPIVAGLDKFFHLLVNWDQYLPPLVNNLVGGHGHELTEQRTEGVNGHSTRKVLAIIYNKSQVDNTYLA